MSVANLPRGITKEETSMPLKHSTRASSILLFTVLLFTTTLAGQQTRPRTVGWVPPEPRLKAKIPFAPRPFGGGNIFKGEAEGWLATAAAKLGSENTEPLGDPILEEYVSAVGRNLAKYSRAPQKSYQFIIVDSDEPDSYTGGGGIIYVTLGLLKQVESEDELAGLLAHEIAHDAFHHAAKTVTRQLFWMTGVKKVNSYDEVEKALIALSEAYERKPLIAIAELLAGFSRFQELEADRAAFYTAYRAGYNPSALATLMKRIEHVRKEKLGKEYKREQFLMLLFGMHPLTAQRTLALSWESNFVKMPPKGTQYSSPAFHKMKSRLATRATQSE
jgi:predicted Zn-dependent protease